jgi:drug/metabolite transporter (DMT)-like permease
MRKGPLYNLVATLAFATMTALVKDARGELDPFAMVFWRCVMAIPFGLPVWGLRWKIVSPAYVGVRTILGFLAMTTIFTAAKDLPLANLSLIGRLQPVLVALFAPLILGAGERAPRAAWLALGVGVVSSVVMLAPELRAGGAWDAVALALLSCLFSAGAHIAIRGLGPREDPQALVFWFHVGSAALACAATLALHGPAGLLPSPELLPILLLVGATAFVGQTMMTLAYSFDRAALVVAVTYADPVFAAIFDTLFFAGPPPGRVVVGGLLVIAASLLVLVDREKKPETARPPPA